MDHFVPEFIGHPQYETILYHTWPCLDVPNVTIGLHVQQSGWLRVLMYLGGVVLGITIHIVLSFFQNFLYVDVQY